MVAPGGRCGVVNNSEIGLPESFEGIGELLLGEEHVFTFVGDN